MKQADEFHNLDDPHDGLFRELGPGISTHIFAGEQAMLSVVSIAPNAMGTLHHPRGAVGRASRGLGGSLPGRRGNRGEKRRLLANAGQRPAHDARRS